MNTCLRLSAAAVCLLITARSVAAGETPLPRDDKNVYGQFDNGFHYIIRPHDNPPKRVALYLHVKTGALNEADDQNGLAHFLEHMAFNGSTHFPPGELVPYLNRLGMRFGADTNAHTNYQETVYKLFMPDTKAETVERALTIFGDYADGLLLSNKEIDEERHVILEEARARKSAAERLQKEMMRKVFEGTRIALHDVIGDEDQIRKFPRERFTDYWNTWYRPENMTLVVVGDIQPDAVIAAARKAFADLKPRGKARAPGSPGIRPYDTARAFVLTDPEQIVGRLELQVIRPGRPPMKTFEDYRFNEIENIGTWIVNRRFRDAVAKGTASFRNARAVVSSMLHDAILPTLAASGEPEDWNKMLDQVVMEASRAIEYGFTEEELDLAKKAVLSSSRRFVEIEPTMNARAFVSRISGAVGTGEPLVSAAQNLELIEKILPTVTVSEVHRVFVDNFKSKNYTCVLYLPKDKNGFKIPSTQDVLAAASAAWARKTAPVKEGKHADSLLAALPKPGRIVDQATDDALKVATATLANGVVLHHRYMDYKKDQVYIRMVFVGGGLEETAENHGIGQVAGIAFRHPATSRLDSTQIRDMMTDKNIRVSGSIDLDAMTVSVSGSPKDLETGLQLAYAILTDGHIEAAAFDNWKRVTLQRLDQMKTLAQGRLLELLAKNFFGGDVRLSPLTPEEVEKLSPEAGKRWLHRIADTAALEVAIVGDIARDDAMSLAKRYLGSLPKRAGGFSALDGLRKVKRGDGPYADTLEFESITPKAVALTGFVGCDYANRTDRHVLTLAARILSDRMIKQIREEQQLVYSIGCRSQPAVSIPGTGMFFAFAPTDPENGDRLAEAVTEMMKTFAEKGPSDEELATAKKQIRNDIETRSKEPRFWVTQFADIQYRGRSWEDLHKINTLYDAFTTDQVRETVSRYVVDKHAIRFVVVPETKSAPTKTEEKQPAPVGG